MRKNCLYLIVICIFSLALVACGSGRDGSSDQNATNATSEAEVSEITTTANATTLPADGQSTSTIQATAVDEGNDPVSEATINFTAESGSLSSEKEVTDDEGKATVTYTAPSGVPEGATDVINATAASGVEGGLFTSDSVSIELKNPRSAAGQAFSISAEYLNIAALNEFQLENQITVSIADRFGTSVSDGTPVSFKTYGTGGYFVDETVKTSGGTATATLQSGGTQPNEGFLSVTAETQGGPSTRITALEIAPGPNNSRRIFAGTNGGGIYRTTNSSMEWENISRSPENAHYGQNWMLPYIKGTNNIDVDPNNPDTVYAGTGYLGKGQLFQSLDAGLSWNTNTEQWNGLRNLKHAVMAVIQGPQGYVWYGTEGDGAYYSMDDRESFSSANSGLTHGTTVKDMVHVSGTSGASARLYAGTKKGIYRSDNGGQDWSKITTDDFVGSNISCLALHPDSDGTDDILYAGTERAGVWVSTDSGSNWDNPSNGLESLNIRDVAVDATNNYLYAATYSQATGNETNPTGMVYSNSLNATDGSVSSGAWNSASDGIKNYPLDNSTLYPVHVIKYDSESEHLYAGGEGINFYTAGSGLEEGRPQWETSNSGLSNLIMARMPILFSGNDCQMWINRLDTTSFEVYIQDINGNPPIEESTLTVEKIPEEEETETLLDVDYSDTQVHVGTHRDPNDRLTDKPYTVSFTPATNETGEVEFTFTPTCEDSAPGCSGSEQIEKYDY